MAAYLLLICVYVTKTYWLQFGLDILLNFAYDKKAYYRRILNLKAKMKEVNVPR